MHLNKFYLPFAVFLFTANILSVVHLQLDNPLLLAERFLKGGGWYEIFIIAAYGAIVAFKMRRENCIFFLL
jgi:hypothetical protein